MIKMLPDCGLMCIKEDLRLMSLLFSQNLRHNGSILGDLYYGLMGSLESTLIELN